VPASLTKFCSLALRLSQPSKHNDYLLGWLLFASFTLLAASSSAQDTSLFTQIASPIASPQGRSATQVLGSYDQRAGYVNGQWIEILYGRPIKRERNLFDLPDWREAILDGAPVWRAGANVSTRLRTQVELVFGDTTVPPGEYSVFIDFGESAAEPTWTFILSRWPVQLDYDYENKSALWGAYEYTREKDVARSPMTVGTNDISFDQLSWQFANVKQGKGSLVLIWDQIRATVEFIY
jgi:hypothetical protein